LSPAGVLTTLHAFDCSVSGEPTDCGPTALLQASDGNFYGATSGSGASGGGTVFKLTPGGVFTTLHIFDCNTEGCFPAAALIQARDGSLYGTTTRGGAFGGGTVFKRTPGGTLTTLHAFDCSTEGCNVGGALLQASDRNFYGTTPLGGASG